MKAGDLLRRKHYDKSVWLILDTDEDFDSVLVCNTNTGYKVWMKTIPPPPFEWEVISESR